MGAKCRCRRQSVRPQLERSPVTQAGLRIRIAQEQHRCAKLSPMPLIVILIILLLLFGGGGFYMGPGVGYYGGGGLSFILLLVVLYLLFGRGRGRI